MWLTERIYFLMLSGHKDLSMHLGQLFHITVISVKQRISLKIVEAVFNIWSQRDLSLYGRILTEKTLYSY